MKKLLACIVLVLACLTMTFMACQPIDSSSTEGPATIQDAKTFLKAMYKDAATVTPSDYERVAMLSLTGTDGKDYLFPVEWSAVVTTEGAPEGLINVTKNEDGKAYTIDVDEDAQQDYEYTLTATIKNAEGTESLTLDFKYTLPKFHVSTYAEYVDLEKDKAVTIEGIITAITSKTLEDANNCLYVNDLNNEGGYYVYQMTEDPLTESFENLNDASKKYALAVGMKVQVKGVKDNHSGTLEIKSPKVTILDAGVTEVTPVDFTEIYKAAAAKKDLKATDLVYKQALLVKISGVEITGQDTDSGYYKFKLDGLESYVRISSSVCPLNAADTEAFKKLHTEKFGNIADVCGVICVYDGAFYLTPVDVNAFRNFTLPPKTPAEQVAFEKEALTVADNITKDSKITLATKGTAYEDVTITWALDKTYSGVTLNNGVLAVELQETAQTIKLTATLTNGTVSETKEFEVLIDAKETIEYVPVAITAPVEGTYKLYLYQATLEKTLYFDGAVNKDEYLETTEKTSKAADVVLAKSGDGYTMTVNGKFIEVYINSNNKQRLKLFDEANGTWAWNEELKLFTWTIDTKTYYLGTFNKYNTMSASDASYIVKDPSIIGKTQFVAYLATLKDKNEVTDEEKLAAIVGKMNTTVTADFELDSTVTWTVKSGEAITIEGNTAKVTRPAAGSEDATVVLTATLGNATQDVTITVTAMPSEELEEVSLADFLAKSDNTKVFYKISGVVVEVSNTKYGNIYISDGETVVYVYGLCASRMEYNSGWQNIEDFNTLGIESGMYVTLASAKGSFSGNAQAVGSGLIEKRAGTDVEKTYVDKYSAQKKLDKISVDGIVSADIKLDTNAEWTSSNSSAIEIVKGESTVTGKVTRGESDVEVTLTATVTVNGQSVSKEFKVTVQKSGEAALLTETISIEKYAAANGWTNGTQYQTVEGTVFTVSATTSKANANTGKYYTSGYEWRIYQYESPALKFEAKEGYKIVSVKVTYNSKTSGALLNGSTEVASATVVTLTEDSITFGVTGSTNGQVKITSIDVVYMAA